MLTAVVAVANNNAIGKDNDLLVKIPRDLKRFKDITTGHTMILGRKNFQSLPRVLPNRHHIVLTRDKDFKVEDDRVTVIHSTEDLKPYIESKEEYFVVGGGQIYKLLLPYTDKVYITKVNAALDADTFFPDLKEDEWEITYKEKGIRDEQNPYDYEYIDYKRI
ncbi:dihydrofolate reductase [Clostridium algidicarnis]|uniref:Dihydrofolate reductase n=2 Tax=Clostridium algidicarnis TaxID=37659 RepID=A0A2S6FX00_9CLOT|nr:dihydrofolate reductase [Clostridium algidicarnis]MBB6632295.1 dihydrofolate reductase [Clostridium algidicarnis]MBB6698317.1 dihydrofolate reductase [Clostridium algidicarnis]MBU3193627.1 dihydrofolate reductase [Clostridium algidicarnis]MBU3197526.1 dihydrofolate reductase [Clostridium algidicarnis]MBU3204930.1 dihydrofolate reductase [Clostridium algidicarnis]